MDKMKKKDENNGKEQRKKVEGTPEIEKDEVICQTGEEHQVDNGELQKEIDALNEKLEEKTSKCDEYISMLQRTAAEFDNYKKRTAKEKEAIYGDAVSDVIGSFLPVVDNFERALGTETSNEGEKSLKEGIELVFRQMKEIMKKLGVEEIKSVGESFDPQIHNAVMHVDDESYGENTVVEEFQKGYRLNDKIIRHSMVKVAN